MKNPIQLRNATDPITISLNRSLWRRGFLFIPLAFAAACLALSPQARADCGEGCDLGKDNTFLGVGALTFNTTGVDNTAIGNNALASNATGSNNTASGASALFRNTTGRYNTANGYEALNSNTTGDANTANGYEALLNNTTGGSNTANGIEALTSNTTGSFNTAIGGGSLSSNTKGSSNTASGASALFSNSTGSYNTANGSSVLFSNTTGFNNTATGFAALESNTAGSSNTANGYEALVNNTTGFNNTANGYEALFTNITGANNVANGDNALLSNTTGSFNAANGVGTLKVNTTGTNNTADGYRALFNNTTGSSNIAIGSTAGTNLTTGSNNIDIGALGNAGDANTMRLGKNGTQTNTYIAGVSGVTVAGGVGVIVDSSGHLGTVVSSERFKDAIKPMDKASEAIFALKPVTFRYKHNLDPVGIPQFGLVAEQVEKVNPDLVARDEQGKPYTVRYEAVNAMLLNEFLKEHRKVEELEAAMAQQKSDFQSALAKQQQAEKEEMKALTTSLKEQATQLQKVREEMQVNKAAPRLVAVDN